MDQEVMLERNSADKNERSNGQPHDAGDGFAEARERKKERERGEAVHEHGEH